MPAAVLVGLTACDRPRHVAIRVSIPGPDTVETPITGVGLVALPYDRDSVLRDLERRARTPRPPTAPLESLFAGFRGPFTAYSAATLRLAKLGTSMACPAVCAALAALLSADPGYRNLPRDVTRAQYAWNVLLRNLRSLGLNSTYQGYDSIVQGLSRRAGREPVTDTTGSDGWAHLTLAPGRWWI